MFKKKLNQKGVMTYILIWLLFLVSIIFIFTFIIPFGVRFTSQMYASTEYILSDANTAAAQINNSTARESLQGSIQGASDTLTDSTANLSMYVQFSWIFILIIVTIVIFLFTRQNVERGGLA